MGSQEESTTGEEGSEDGVGPGEGQGEDEVGEEDRNEGNQQEVRTVPDDEDAEQEVYIGSFSFRLRWRRRCPFLFECANDDSLSSIIQAIKCI